MIDISIANALLVSASTLLGIFLTQRFQIASANLASKRALAAKILEIKLSKIEESYFIFHKWTSSFLSACSSWINYCDGEIDLDNFERKIKAANLLNLGDHEKNMALLQIYLPELLGLHDIVSKKVNDLIKIFSEEMVTEGVINVNNKDGLKEIRKKVQQGQKEFIKACKDYEDKIKEMSSELLSLKRD
ncbi:hypothetical protein ACEU07_14650 [Chromobacterium violaceum]|uniref:hypothetical protein n=1 Tax=Chromobacterium violaceum TaxID=536 RepID=UPI0035A6355A